MLVKLDFNLTGEDFLDGRFSCFGDDVGVFSLSGVIGRCGFSDNLGLGSVKNPGGGLLGS